MSFYMTYGLRAAKEIDKHGKVTFFFFTLTAWGVGAKMMHITILGLNLRSMHLLICQN